MESKKDILWRVYLIYFFICLFAVAIISKIFIIQFSEGEEWRAKADRFSTKFFDIEAVRGNIYDANGSLLATSLPYLVCNGNVAALFSDARQLGNVVPAILINRIKAPECIETC